MASCTRFLYFARVANIYVGAECAYCSHCDKSARLYKCGDTVHKGQAALLSWLGNGMWGVEGLTFSLLWLAWHKRLDGWSCGQVWHCGVTNITSFSVQSGSNFSLFSIHHFQLGLSLWDFWSGTVVLCFLPGSVPIWHHLHGLEFTGKKIHQTFWFLCLWWSFLTPGVLSGQFLCLVHQSLVTFCLARLYGIVICQYLCTFPFSPERREDCFSDTTSNVHSVLSGWSATDTPERCLFYVIIYCKWHPNVLRHRTTMHSQKTTPSVRLSLVWLQVRQQQGQFAVWTPLLARLYICRSTVLASAETPLRPLRCE